MLTIIYPYRERDLQRIKRSLDSLVNQTKQDFNVQFVDYGSSQKHAKSVKELVDDYGFSTYNYCFTQFQPWNKSKALNSIIKNLSSGHFFVADVDMIFHKNFVEKAQELANTNAVWYFKVGFLDEKESAETKEFEAYKIKFNSEKGATGLTLCPVEAAHKINGFDEFYHFWGSEDTDFHVRLANAGYDINFYEAKIFMLHQWHIIYRNKEVNQLTKDLRLTGIVQYNQQYLEKAKAENKIKVNHKIWGEIQTESEFLAFQNKSENNFRKVGISRLEIDYFLFQELPKANRLNHYEFKLQKTNLKSKAKSILGKSKSNIYTLKEVNDLLLFHIVNLYHQNPYSYKISDDLSTIHFSIKK